MADFLGIVSAEQDPPGLDRGRWRDLIVSHPPLRADGKDAAWLVVAGVDVAHMTWTDNANAIDVHGVPSAVSAIAEVAVLLEGRFVSLEELTSC